ncbi:hypothetical protein [Flavobacterium adhaerens]|uniref:beta-xylosidase family glycoside hydrolase n=1 Tax=Flavobacterium adhaerens TaxID=3149043 RepID=UPI0032B6267A
MAPVKWDAGKWPIVNENGTVALDMNVPTLPQVLVAVENPRTEFDKAVLGKEWNYLCIPNMNNYSLTERKGFLRIRPSEKSLDMIGNPSFVGRRQQHIDFKSSVSLDYSKLKEGSRAGITVYMANDYHYDMSVKHVSGKFILSLTYSLGALRHTEKEIPLQNGEVVLGVDGSGELYKFYYLTSDGTRQDVGQINTRFISSETAGGFTGVFLGLFADGKVEKDSFADFDWFEY